MKFAYTALIVAVAAGPIDDNNGPAPLDLNEMYPNKQNLWANDWAKYKKSRQLMVDCDIYESENWLGTGKCKYSWECRGARMCEGQGWCYGDDGCEEIHE